MNRLLFLFAFVCATAAQAQNLVVNGSFEDYTECPSTWEQVDFATGWSELSASPDYFNRCCTNDSVGVPLNSCGNQEPFDGDGYMGMHTYIGEGNWNYREYIQSELASPLIPGVPVFISLRASPGGFGNNPYNLMRYASSGIGVKFSMQAHNTQGLLWPGNVAISMDSVLGDTSAWMLVSGQYVPDSAYTYIDIGCFIPDALLQIQVLDPSSTWPVAYAFVDAICVSMNEADCPLTLGVHQMVHEPCSMVVESGGEALRLRFGCRVVQEMVLDLVDMTGRIRAEVLVHSGASDMVFPMQGIVDGAYIIRERNPSGRFRPVRIVHINP